MLQVEKDTIYKFKNPIECTFSYKYIIIINQTAGRCG